MNYCAMSTSRSSPFLPHLARVVNTEDALKQPSDSKRGQDG
jgi:hypothetical protein